MSALGDYTQSQNEKDVMYADYDSTDDVDAFR